MNKLVIKDLQTSDYQSVWQAMRDFTINRDESTPDELWLVEHPAVFTQGQAGKPEHLLNPGQIPVVQTDRGGQVTYHGPGQLVAYPLLDLRRQQLGVRDLVTRIESLVVTLLADFGVTASGNCDARGVYVAGKKICSIGLRIKKGCSYHGLALNVNMDLAPFGLINPCGYKELSMTQIADFEPSVTMRVVKKQLIKHFHALFGYSD